MNHKNDLSFLCDIFKKHHIDASLISPGDLKSHTQDTRLTRITGCNKTHEELEKIADNFLQSTKYILTNELRLKYVFFKTLVSGERNVLLIGPYLSAPLNTNDIFRISTQFNCGTDSQKLLNDYYASIPILPENDKLFVILDIFCERMWQTSSLSTVVISNTDNSTVDIMPQNAANEKKYDEIIKNAEQLEMRYAIENEMLNAVRLGQENKEKKFFPYFDESALEKRTPDSLRNAKNYCIIMNTLLRKAAEQGGVHPLYIDDTSSEFAKSIEHISDISDILPFMKKMFSSYCRLVYQNNEKKYSNIVKKALLIIYSDISAELSLSVIAKKLDVSAGYLATIFKKETKKTISEYIIDMRIQRAMELLNTTNLQIQTVAMHCGIMDVQYFSKIFKKRVGKPPKEYRENKKSKTNI